MAKLYLKINIATKVKNMVGTIVNKGLEMMAKLLGGVSTAPFKYIGLGSGTDAEAAGDTALTTEITTNGGARAEADVTYEAGYICKINKTFNITGDLAVNEVGVFNADADGDMLYRAKLAATRNLVNGDKVEIDVQITFSTA